MTKKNGITKYENPGTTENDTASWWNWLSVTSREQLMDRIKWESNAKVVSEWDRLPRLIQKKIHEDRLKRIAGNFWDNIDQSVRDQIMFELDYEPNKKLDDEIEKKYPDEDMKCWDMMASIFKREFEKNYVDYDNSKSKTLKEIRFQHDNPKNMEQTETWFSDLEYPYLEETFGKSYCQILWEDLEDEQKWNVHEVRLENMSPPIILKESISLLKEKRLTEKVTCWHCGFTEQKILSDVDVFKCDKCHDLLWTGDGGFEMVVAQ
jgi:hypothetical protein